MQRELTSGRAFVARFNFIEEEFLIPPVGKLRVVVFDTLSGNLSLLTHDVEDLAEGEEKLGKYPGINGHIVGDSSQTLVKGYVFDYDGNILVERGSF